MKYLFFLFMLSTCLLIGAQGPVFAPSEASLDIHIDNRVLAQVNGKPITVFDVMKKMDVVFFRQYPEYVSSKAARCQFYQISWKPVLKDLIEKELMMADAKELKVEVSGSEIRQEMENSFGPNIIYNLDKIGMTLAEAKEILESEILIRKIMGFKVHSKAFRAVNPQQVKEAYAKWVKEHEKPEVWVYQVMTFRDSKDKEKSFEAAKLAFDWLSHKKVQSGELAAEFKRLAVIADTTKVQVSDELSVPVDEILPEYFEVLSTLDLEQVSQPIEQFSRRDQKSVHRLFRLVAKQQETVPSLKSMENALKNDLLQAAAEKEAKEYMAYLKDHFSVNDTQFSQVGEDWQPFHLEEK